MNTIPKILISLSLTLLLVSCGTSEQQFEILVSNPGEEMRSELVTIDLSSLGSDVLAMKFLVVKNADTGEEIISQMYDRNADSTYDELLINCEIEAQSEKKFIISETESMPEYESKLFSRFVPERTDDFAWENDQVAFRTFGPTAQKMAEEGDKEGTLSSGMDCWLKKVDYPIINKWYKKATSGEGSYHIDTGEGFDNFHVGASRGCGGLGVYIDEKLYTSKNFTAWNVLANGPLQTRFVLDYADWKTPESVISESKEISLDLGSNLMKIEASVEGTDMITVGLTLHENDGAIAVDTMNTWFSYWQAHGDSELGMGIVCLPKYFHSYILIESKEKDQSHLLVHLNVIDGKVEYYTGFAWKESRQYPSVREWTEYLKKFSEELQHPLVVEIID